MTSLPGPPRRGGVSQIRIRPPRRLRRDYFFRRARAGSCLIKNSIVGHSRFSRTRSERFTSAFELKRFSWFRVFSPPVLKLYFKLWRRGLKQEPYGGEDIYQSGGDFLLDSRGNVLYAYRSRDPADRPTPQTLLREIDRVQLGVVPLTPLLTCGLTNDSKCSCAVAVISFSSGRLSTALSHPAGPSRRDQRDTRIRP